MSEAYIYGGNGSKERIEYNELNEHDLAKRVEKVSTAMELIFTKAPSSLGMVSHFSQDKDGMYRKVTSTYMHEDSTLLFDIDSGSILKVLGAPSINDVKIEHALYTEGVLNEEYIMKLIQNDPSTIGAFSTRYHISNYAGGFWQATVEHIDIENDDYNMIRQQNNSKYYTRKMTPYDFEEFLKVSDEIKAQLGIVLVQ
ncbi:MAG: hypothetical protein JWN28_782 [Candidatus Saccharibacteria bacterium]|nr:hypothetical protein [Candidatus Saccharibacteria bacterium]